MDVTTWGIAGCELLLDLSLMHKDALAAHKEFALGSTWEVCGRWHVWSCR